MFTLEYNYEYKNPTKKDTDLIFAEKAEIFAYIEPYLTLLNVHQLERQGVDIRSQVEELEQLNQLMRNRDKMKDDDIAHLSDQLVAITVRYRSLRENSLFNFTIDKTLTKYEGM
jgi:hypothetical protein